MKKPASVGFFMSGFNPVFLLPYLQLLLFLNVMFRL